MFSEKRQADDVQAPVSYFLQFINFNHVLKAAVLEQEHEGRILEPSTIVTRNDYFFNLVPNLKQSLEEDMVLMVMRDQHVINGIREVEIGVARNAILVGVAEDRIKQ